MASLSSLRNPWAVAAGLGGIRGSESPSSSTTLWWHATTTTPSISTAAQILAILLALAYLIWKRFKMTQVPYPPFKFLDLPPELRDMVYEYLVEDPEYPAPAPFEKQNPYIAHLKMFIPGAHHQQPSTMPCWYQEPQKRKSNWILLANKQVHAEYMDLLVKKAKFHLAVSPANYQPSQLPSSNPISPTDNPRTAIMPTTTTTIGAVNPNTSSPTTQQQQQQQQQQLVQQTTQPTSPAIYPKLWPISPYALSTLSSLTLHLTTTSTMLGVDDPRAMPPASWSLAHIISSQLSPLSTTRLKELNLHVKAIGDPLWNPLWVWYHASLAFKGMRIGAVGAASGASLSSQRGLVQKKKKKKKQQQDGLGFGKITFSLDSHSPGENHLVRIDSWAPSTPTSPASSTTPTTPSPTLPTTTPTPSIPTTPSTSSKWAWFCASDHMVCSDSGSAPAATETVREFCARIFMECPVCRPELESEDEG